MAQIADAGARYVIIGHSERRQLFSETDANVARKAKAALGLHLTPSFASAKPWPSATAGQALGRVSSQLDGATRELSDDERARS